MLDSRRRELHRRSRSNRCFGWFKWLWQKHHHTANSTFLWSKCRFCVPWWCRYQKSGYKLAEVGIQNKCTDIITVLKYSNTRLKITQMLGCVWYVCIFGSSWFWLQINISLCSKLHQYHTIIWISNKLARSWKSLLMYKRLSPGNILV